MPILDIGYRKWEGPRSPAWTRAWVVASTGVGLVWGSTWIRRILMLLTFPSLLVAIAFGVFEQNLNESTIEQAIAIVKRDREVRKMLDNAGLEVQDLRNNPSAVRHFAWSYLLFTLFRYPQAFGMILVVGLVGPRMISYDLRSRGYLLYLSRPLTPAEYIMGKAGVLYTLLFLVVTIPALTIYVVGLFLSTDPWAIVYTWDIPLRIIAASVVLILPTSAIALALSSMTQESRYAGFAWFAIWILGHVTYSVLWFAQQFRGASRRTQVLAENYNSLMYLSPYELLGYIQKKIFGLMVADTPILMPVLVALGITVSGYAIAYWRVSRILKI